MMLLKLTVVLKILQSVLYKFSVSVSNYSANKTGNWINANYYDDLQLFEQVKDFMIASLKKHFSMGLQTNEVYVLGVKNARFLKKINDEHHFFDKMIILEHPRYIQQYKSKDKELYIDKYLRLLTNEY